MTVSPADKEAYIASIEENSARLAAAARQGLEPPVPSCPGWTVAMLVGHIGGVQHGWAQKVEDADLEPPGFHPEVFEQVPGLLPWTMAVFEGEGEPGPVPEGLIEWFEGATRHLAAALRGSDLETPIWHWSGDNTMEATLRMQRVEAALHRWDAQLAHGQPEAIDAETAALGIDHYFEVMMPMSRRQTEPVQGAGESFHFHRTDGPGEWYVRFDGPDVDVVRGHRKGDVAARGSASDLLLFLWGRLPADRLEVMGDRSLLDRWQEFVPAIE